MGCELNMSRGFCAHRATRNGDSQGGSFYRVLYIRCADVTYDSTNKVHQIYHDAMVLRDCGGML